MNPCSAPAGAALRSATPRRLSVEADTDGPVDADVLLLIELAYREWAHELRRPREGKEKDYCGGRVVEGWMEDYAEYVRHSLLPDEDGSPTDLPNSLDYLDCTPCSPVKLVKSHLAKHFSGTTVYVDSRYPLEWFVSASATRIARARLRLWWWWGEGACHILSLTISAAILALCRLCALTTSALGWSPIGQDLHHGSGRRATWDGRYTSSIFWLGRVMVPWCITCSASTCGRQAPRSAAAVAV